MPTFECDPSIEYQITKVNEVEECQYVVLINTKYACDYNITTTSQPNGQCIFTSNVNGTLHILDMRSLRGQLISSLINNTSGEYFVYTPCDNIAKCGDDNNKTLAMSYLFDAAQFECTKYLAIWEDGINQPLYSNEFKTWQFTFDNGQQCEGGPTVFQLDWICYHEAIEPLVNSSRQIAECVYQMVIYSVLACN